MKKETKNKRKWEYLIVEDCELKDLNKLGEKGWELISVKEYTIYSMGEVENEGYEYIFKRSKRNKKRKDERQKEEAIIKIVSAFIAVLLLPIFLIYWIGAIILLVTSFFSDKLSRIASEK